MQGAAHQKVIEGSQDFDWMHHFTGLSKSLLRFGINSVTNTLPTVDNLKRWGYLRVGEESCALCGDPKPTITHVLSMCKVAFGDGAPDGFNRIKWRHDNILKEFIDSIAPHVISQEFRVFVDLEGHQYQYAEFPEELVESSLRPDIILWNDTENKVILAELTCPMEHNMEAAFIRKLCKYDSLKKELEHKGFDVSFFPFEVTARGICAVTVSEFLMNINYGRKKSAELKYRLSKMALSSSHTIFLKRNNRYWLS